MSVIEPKQLYGSAHEFGGFDGESSRRTRENESMKVISVEEPFVFYS